eukprot:12295765-Ditylum_brightwellii.AAC.1
MQASGVSTHKGAKEEDTASEQQSVVPETELQSEEDLHLSCRSDQHREMLTMYNFGSEDSVKLFFQR